MIIVILITCFQNTFAQTGTALEFNQVRLLTATSDNSGAQWTVPAGKVWKIELLGTGSASSDNPLSIYFNSNLAFDYRGAYYSSSYATSRCRYSNSPKIIWLPENTTIGTVAPTPTAFRWISIIEFNVVP